MEEKELSSTYELTVLFPQDLSDFDVQKVMDKVKTSITSKGGTIQKEHTWGKKRLAYHIGNVEFAHYQTVVFNSLKEVIAEIDKDIRLTPEIIRHLLISLEKEGVEMDQLFTPEKEAAILVSTAKEKMEPRTSSDPRFSRRVARTVGTPVATEKSTPVIDDTEIVIPEEVIEPIIAETKEDATKRREELDKKLDELLKEE
mgnify:CR=1 FL=1